MVKSRSEQSAALLLSGYEIVIVHSCYNNLISLGISG